MVDGNLLICLDSPPSLTLITFHPLANSSLYIIFFNHTKMYSLTLYRFHPQDGCMVLHYIILTLRRCMVLHCIVFTERIFRRIPRFQGMTITSLFPGLKLIVFRLVNSGMTISLFSLLYITSGTKSIACARWVSIWIIAYHHCIFGFKIPVALRMRPWHISLMLNRARPERVFLNCMINGFESYLYWLCVEECSDFVHWPWPHWSPGYKQE